ncbi:MAG TPA: glycosyltransferase family 39 protein [Candidatus Polarisedimenticolaceae bacterium]|nr:glycosyltransferase family 39 protein [Candidatus Polarisedimenticolaceae bacterium]
MTGAARRDLLLLLAGSLLLFGAALGAHDLWNPNEPIYGEAVKEMHARGSLLVPYVNGLPFGEKPILSFWLGLVASSLLGSVSETSVRMPSVLAGTSIVILTYLLVLPYAGRGRALAAATFTLTTYQVWWVSTTLQMDVLVAAATIGVIVPLTRVLDFGLAPWKGWSLAGLAAGLGFLAKGPVAWICPALVIGTYAAFSSKLRALMTPAIALGAAVAFVIAVPWFLALAMTGHADVLHEVLIRQNFQRFTNPWDHVAPFWYYVPYVFIDMAPYAFFAVLAVRLPREDDGERRLARLAWVWIAAIVVFFSFSKSKRDPYIVPIAPAVAVLAMEVLSGTRRRRAVTAIALTLAAGLIGAGLYLSARVAPKYPDATTTGRWLAATAVIGGVFLGLNAFRNRRVALALPALCAAVYLVVAVFVLPALDVYKSARPLTEAIAAMAGDSKVASYNFWEWRSEYRYYLDRPIENLTTLDALREAWSAPERLVLLVEGSRLAIARTVIGDRAPALTRAVGSQTLYVFTNR